MLTVHRISKALKLRALTETTLEENDLLTNPGAQSASIQGDRSRFWSGEGTTTLQFSEFVRLMPACRLIEKRWGFLFITL